MPRTKNVRKPKQERGRNFTEESDLLMKDFERQAHLRILKQEGEGKMAIKSYISFIDVTFSRLPSEIREMTLNEILNCEVDNEKENCSEVSSSVDNYSLPSVPTKVKGKKNRITASDDGYVTEGVAATRLSRAPKGTEPTPASKTRSSSRNSRIKLSQASQECKTVKKISKKERNKESIKSNKFMTPATLKPGNHEFGLITPKIKPNTPLNVLRRPRQGEMVLSMQGSPLLVSAIVREDTANINVPLANGNVISLLPNDGLRMSHIPQLDPETVKQLETLKNHIETVMSAN